MKLTVKAVFAQTESVIPCASHYIELSIPLFEPNTHTHTHIGESSVLKKLLKQKILHKTWMPLGGGMENILFFLEINKNFKDSNGKISFDMKRGKKHFKIYLPELLCNFSLLPKLAFIFLFNYVSILHFFCFQG